MTVTGNAWLPKATCDEGCMHAGAAALGSRPAVWTRTTLRVTGAVLLFLAVPLLAVPLPGRSHLQRAYCRLMLRCVGVRITVSGGPIRNLRGVLVVSGHVSWLDIFSIGAVLPGSFVARADLIETGADGSAAIVDFKSGGVPTDKVVAEIKQYEPRILKTSLSKEQEDKLRALLAGPALSGDVSAAG